jgi:hypothetical protein
MNLCYKVALNNYHGSKPYQMGWHDRRNDNKYREYKIKKEIIIEENHCLIGIEI